MLAALEPQRAAIRGQARAKVEDFEQFGVACYKRMSRERDVLRARFHRAETSTAASNFERAAGGVRARDHNLAVAWLIGFRDMGSSESAKARAAESMRSMARIGAAGASGASRVAGVALARQLGPKRRSAQCSGAQRHFAGPLASSAERRLPSPAPHTGSRHDLFGPLILASAPGTSSPPRSGFGKHV